MSGGSLYYNCSPFLADELRDFKTDYPNENDTFYQIAEILAKDAENLCKSIRAMDLYISGDTGELDYLKTIRECRRNQHTICPAMLLDKFIKQLETKEYGKNVKSSA